MLDLGASLLPHLDGFLVFVEVDSGFLQNGFCIALDQLELVIAERLIGLDLATDIARRRRDLIGACRTAGIGPATGSAAGWCGL